QILAGFGIESAILFRGTSGEGEASELAWESPDGSKVLLIRVHPDYCYADFQFSEWNENLDMRAFGAKKMEAATTDVLYALDGSDHCPADWTLPGTIRKANEELDDIDCFHSSFSEYLRDLFGTLGDGWRDGLQRFVGELRYPAKFGKWAGIAQGIGSGRMPLKQANDAQEWLLAGLAEPLSVWSGLLGGDCQKAFIDLSWRYLIQNHPHDSIVGCSIDQVHRDMTYRFDQSRLIADNSVSESVQDIFGCIGTDGLRVAMEGGTLSAGGAPSTGGSSDAGGAPSTGGSFGAGGTTPYKAFAAFNMATAPSGPVTPVEFEVDSATYGRMTSEGKSLRITDGRGAEVPFQITHVEADVRMRHFTKKHRSPYPAFYADQSGNSQVHRISALVEGDVPPMGYRTWALGFVKGGAGERGMRPNPAMSPIENEYLRVKPNADGSLDVTDKRTGATFAGINALVDDGDAGNGWNHIKPALDREVWSTDGNHSKVILNESASGELMGEIRIGLEMSVPADLTEDRKARGDESVTLRVGVAVTLMKGERFARVKVKVANNARCHRLRAMFPTRLKGDVWHADTAYDMVERRVRLLDTAGWKQKDKEDAPIKNFVAFCDGKAGLAVLSKGLNEAAVQDTDERAITLTLFRGFYQYMNFQPIVEGQLLGELTAEYAIAPFAPEGGIPPVALFAEAARYKLPTACVTGPFGPGHLGLEGSLLSWDGPCVLQALKPAEDGGGVVVRMLNPSRDGATARFRLSGITRMAWLADLKEARIRPLHAEGGMVSLPLRGKEVATVYLEA
ncbi:MAG: glycosyl hydrolase-related protein, partial [Oscillospiraceae bacterium]|nr:glycosyl hydrolase-related protein [Oscillospiraceae bacterium]